MNSFLFSLGLFLKFSEAEWEARLGSILRRYKSLWVFGTWVFFFFCLDWGPPISFSLFCSKWIWNRRLGCRPLEKGGLAVQVLLTPVFGISLCCKLAFVLDKDIPITTCSEVFCWKPHTLKSTSLFGDQLNFKFGTHSMVWALLMRKPFSEMWKRKKFGEIKLLLYWTWIRMCWTLCDVVLVIELYAIPVLFKSRKR